MLTLFLGSTTILMVRKFSLNPNEMVSFTRQGVKNTPVVFGVNMFKISVFISPFGTFDKGCC